ncbi:hypothetical protein ACWNT8_07560 [Pigmentibacter ruber]|nr:hypothetical protein [Pigmentibacter ruber]
MRLNAFNEKYFHALVQLKTNGFENYEGHLTRQFTIFKTIF